MDRPKVLVLGIGNVLMGDEGVGVHVVRRLAPAGMPEGARIMDGGTGGLHLLGALQEAERTVLIDATADGAPPGTIRRLRPRFSSDYPRTLTAHDIGLKDLLDAAYLLGAPPDLTLFAVSIDFPGVLGLDLTSPVARAVPRIVRVVREEVDRILWEDVEPWARAVG